MARVLFNNVTKKFDETVAVDNINIDVEDGEFLVLVGPSGCGKTTSLRMLAGLEEATSGDIVIDNKRVNNIAPSERDIAMVFQSYALYPHLTIYDNLAYGLRARTINRWNSTFISLTTLFTYLLMIIFFLVVDYIGASLKLYPQGLGFISALASLFILLMLFPDIRQSIRTVNINFFAGPLPFIRDYKEKEGRIKDQVTEVAEMLEIQDHLWKKPKQLSGGQRQRVALGRAIIRRPKVFLMDEPLSNLDAKLRASTRAELARLQRKLGITTIYVTHDQIEAMTLGHRIAIMSKGRVMQIGTPEEVYVHPQNKTVAGFIGSPAMNFIDGRLHFDGIDLLFTSDYFVYKIPESIKETLKYHNDQEVIIGIRPEHIDVEDTYKDLETVKAKVGVLEPIGSETYIFADLSIDKTMIVKAEGITKIAIESEILLHFREKDLHFFSKETEARLN